MGMVRVKPRSNRVRITSVQNAKGLVGLLPVRVLFAAEVDMTRTMVDHTVTLLLDDDEQFVVPRRGRGYVRVDGITVTFPHEREPRVWAGGIVVRKDGQIGKGWGKTSTSVDLPDKAPWIERARGLALAE